MLLPADPDALYAALLARNPAYDGHWFVGVSTTGVFCRLTCPARKPKREHSTFYPSVRQAEAAGFRACLRCRPCDASRRASAAVERLRQRVAAEPHRRWSGAELEEFGLSASTARRAFKREYGVTFSRYARAQRLAASAATLAAGAPVIEAQLDAGYQSGSGYREAIGRLLGGAPSRARDCQPVFARWIETPIGAMLAIADEAGVRLLEFADRAALPGELARVQALYGPVLFGACALLDRLAAQLSGYFADATKMFDVPVAQDGSAFAHAVWAELRRSAAGTTRSYGELAAALGRPEAARAVARANGANQVAIVVPCHRIIGADGALIGYGGKLWRKRWLLEHERRCALGPARG